MSGPDPVVINFVARGLDDVLKAMKSIADVVTQTEKKSVASAKRVQTEEQRAAKERAEAQARALIKMGELEKAAAITNSQFVQKQLRIRLNHMIEHSKAMYDIAVQAEKKRQEALANLAEAGQKRLDAIRKRATSTVKGEKSDDKWYRDTVSKAEAAEKAKTAAMQAGEKRRQEMLAGLGSVQSKHLLKSEDERRKAQEKADRDLAASRKKAREKAAKEQAEAKEEALSSLLIKGKGRFAAEKDRATSHLKEEAADNQHYRKAVDEAARAEKTKQDAITSVALAEEKKRQDLLYGLGKIKATHDQKAAEEAAKTASAAAEKAAKNNQLVREAFAKTVMGAGGNAVRNATSVAGSVVGAVGRGVLNVGGGFSLEDSVAREVAFRGRASAIAATTNTGVTQAELMKNAREVGRMGGADPEDVLRGYEQVKKLNDDALPQALRVMPDIVKLSTATGTDMGHMGELAANITASFANESYVDEKGEKKKGISDADLKRQLRIFTRQGIEGGVEVEDFAKYGSRITAGATLFGGKRDIAEADLGMAAQIARQSGGAAGPAEATLAAQRFATDLQKKAGSLEGVLGKGTITDEKGSLRGLDDIVVNMLKHQSSVTGISEFKIGERGNRFLTGAADIYRQAGGGEAGEKAIRAKFGAGRKDISEADVNTRFTKRMQEVDKQLEVAMINLRMEVGQKLVPELIKLIPLLAQATPYFASFLGKLIAFVEANPFGSFGTLVVGYFLKELATAQIGDLIKKLLTGGGGGGGPIPNPGGGPGGGGIGGTVMGTALAAGGIMVKSALAREVGVENAQDLTAKVDAWQRGDHERGVSPEKAMAMVDQAKGRLDKGSTLQRAADLATSPFVESSDKAYKQYKADQGLVESKEGQALLKQLVDALKQNTAAQGSGGAGAGVASPGAPQRNGPVGRRPGG